MVTQSESSYESVTPSFLLFHFPFAIVYLSWLDCNLLLALLSFAYLLKEASFHFSLPTSIFVHFAFLSGTTFFFFFLLFTIFSHFFSCYHTFPLLPLWQLHPILSPLPNSSPDRFHIASERSPAQHQARCLTSITCGLTGCPVSLSPARQPCMDSDILFQ